MATLKTARKRREDPLWHKDAIIYQTHVRAFCDSDGDGIGDLRGLTSKLDYLQDLGINTLWLLPFYSSPLRDDGYDIADYVSVHESYGTLRDFKTFLNEAHGRGLRVITELVLNHTSDQHKWFQRARTAKAGSRYRDWYVWSDTTDQYADARIIFRDFESSNWSWDAEAGAYYWHRFYSHQPDLNFDCAAVRRALTRVLDSWFEMGVDGLRLDAIPYLYEREGTSCENLTETHNFLRELRAHVDDRFANRVFLAEANQWPEDAAAYFGEGNECHMCFHFPLMPRLFMALRREDRFPIVEILEQTPEVPDNCQWGIFLRNHDELTLEMVTDSERDYMYRTYGRDPRWRINLGIRRRLAPLLDNSRRRVELMNSLLFSLPGSPIIYYGDEIGMGDNVYLGDRNGVRTPMQWSGDRNAGFSRADPQSLYLPVITTPEYHYETINVETQQGNPQSLLWWNKRMIALRKQHKALGRGSIHFLHPQNPKVLAFLRQDDTETLLVVANMSRFVQAIELDLSAFHDHIPVELFGQSWLPRIDQNGYLLTLGPHAVYWFTLKAPEVPELGTMAIANGLPELTAENDWRELVRADAGEAAPLEEVLPEYLRRQRWFGGKSRRIGRIKIIETLNVPCAERGAAVVFLRVEYTDGEPETYVLCLACAGGETAILLQHDSEVPVLATVHIADDATSHIIYDALFDPNLSQALLEAISHQRRFKGINGAMVCQSPRALRGVLDESETQLEPVVPKLDQSNSSVVFRDAPGTGRYVLKLFRRLEPGINPEVELVRHLSRKTRFHNVPTYAGTMEYRGESDSMMTLAVLQEFVPNEGDAWAYTSKAVRDYFEHVLVRQDLIECDGLPGGSLVTAARHEPPQLAQELIGDFLESARLLGQRTGELHAALAGDSQDADLAPERFLHFHRHALHHEVLGRVRNALRLLQQQSTSALPAAARELAGELVGRDNEIRAKLKALRDSRISARRIRIHGDYHLGQVLFTGKDFVIIDFEGEPAVPLSERRIKRSALRDVAGMLRSFHYAIQSPLVGEFADPVVRTADRAVVEAAAEAWYRWVGASFLGGYLEAVSGFDFLPKSDDEFTVLLEACLFDKAGYELTYELNNRPAWVSIPIRGLLGLLQTA